MTHVIYNTHKHDAPNFPCNGAARARVMAESTVPVETVPGSAQAPELIGERGGFFTTSGIPIQHPNAYAKKGWSGMAYHTDTRKVVVGEKWRPWT